ncbi:MAG: hypothetical protein DMG06_03555 [Acidobacteria bacterium]|nr:MAG: hypothetical protein DMG06_03555 [Acidobacteriota bacterium]
MTFLLGFLLVTIAGLGTGSIAWPIKVMRRFQFEQWWFIGMVVGLLIMPWGITLSSVPSVFAAYGAVDPRLLIKSNIFAFGWGIANVLYAISVVRIGAALTGAILSGLGVAIGVTVPMIFKGTGLFSQAPDLESPACRTVLIGAGMVLIGVLTVSIAGFGRERVFRNTRESSGGFMSGLIMSIAGGVLSCGLSFAFVYSQGPIVKAMKEQGAGNIPANIAVWAVGLLGGVLVNIFYPAYLMTRKKSWNVLMESRRDVILAVIIGLQFITAVTLMGRGMLLLGALGASVGFGIQQAMQILGNQGVGFISGEWRGVLGAPRKQMYIAITILIVAVMLMAYGNMLIQNT